MIYRLAGVCEKDETRQQAIPGSVYRRAPLLQRSSLARLPLPSPSAPALLASRLLQLGDARSVVPPLQADRLAFPRLQDHHPAQILLLHYARTPSSLVRCSAQQPVLDVPSFDPLLLVGPARSLPVVLLLGVLACSP